MFKKAAIVILYNPTEYLSSIELIKDSVDYCFLIDNSENETNINIIPKANNLIYHWVGFNSGIASAQNLGLRLAEENQVNRVIFFDQDSNLSKDMIKKLFESFDTLVSKNVNVGILGPRAFNKDNGNIYSHRDRDHANKIRSFDGRYTPVEYTLSSGSVMPIELFKNCGGYMDDLFIDSVDHELCWRAISKGYHVYIDEDVKLPHMLGQYQKKFLSYNINIPSPIRHYYVFRNWLKLMRFSYVPLSFKIRTLLKLPFKAFYFSFFAGNNIKRMKYIFKGVLDGVINKSGIYKD